MTNLAENGGGDQRRAVFSRLVLVAVVAVLGVLVAGFIIFVRNLATEEPVARTPADGIVVLTGASSRIKDAMDLLADRRGQRLLISGVNPNTTIETFRDTHPQYRDLFDCCVDLGHRALDTIGNAEEAANWARAHAFKSLILVTSSYHMPRSQLEFSTTIPNVRIIAFPVITPQVRIERWWAYPGTFRLLFVEYVKYLAALARTGVFGKVKSIDESGGE